MSFIDPISTEDAILERRLISQNQDRLFGHVVSCTGSKAIIMAQDLPVEASEYWTVSRLISILYKSRRIVGMIGTVETPSGNWESNAKNAVRYHVELIGEVRDDPSTGKPVFDRGISAYPPVGAPSHAIRTEDLYAIYTDEQRSNLITIGHLSQNEDIPASIELEMTLSRHFAIIGSTGVGKSSAVTLMMRKAVEARPNLRILMLDPHNEFAHAFPRHAEVFDSENLSIPYWMLNLEELVEILFRGRKDTVDEIDILRTLIPEAKNGFRDTGENVSLRRDSQSSTISADTPVPYRFADLIKLLDARMGLLESKGELPVLRNLRARLTTAMNDPRYAFFFKMRRVADTMEQTISSLFRLEEGTDRPISVIQMAGLPTEVVNSMISVVGRLAFDVCQMSSGSNEIVMLCEEAHRYLPARTELGFGPTRFALARIAKEGRKYGCYLGCITQRPGELDQTILSQCSTIFAMRLANEADQALIKAAIGDSSESTMAFISSLAQREAIAFGEGVSTPMRLKFETIPKQDLPNTSAGGVSRGGATRRVNIRSVVSRMRDHLPDVQTQIVETQTEVEELEGMDEMTRIRNAVMQRSRPNSAAAPAAPSRPDTPQNSGRLFRPI